MNNLMTSETGNKIKSFWQREEGKTGMLFIGLCLIGAFIGGQLILPSLIAFLGMAITAVGKTMVLAGMLAALGLFLFIVMNPRFQILMKYIFMSSMRWITGIFIEIDPIGIMKNFIQSLREKKADFDKNKRELRGQITACENQVNVNNNEIKKSMDMARAAQKAGNQSQLAVHGRNVERFTAVNERMKGTLTKMNMLYGFLVKYGEAADTMIEDIGNEIRAREMDQKYSTSANNAMRSAMAILKGQGVEQEMYDQALEVCVNDYAMKMGEIDDFMDSTRSIMEGIDLQNGMWQESALRRLEEFENRTTSIVLGGQKQVLLENNTGINPMAISQPTEEYQHLFRN